MWRGWEIFIGGRCFITVVVSLLVGFTTSGVFAQSPNTHGLITESLEWMILDSKVVVVGAIRFETPDEPVDILNRTRSDLLIDISEVMKGAIKPGEQIRVSWSGPGAAPLARGQDVLLCLEESADGGAPKWNFLPHRYVLLNNAVPVMLMSFEQLSQREQILAKARQLAAEKRTAPLQSRIIILPTYATQLRVPVDQRLQELAHQWLASREVKNRLLGIQAIKPFKSPANLAAVKRLLEDTRAYNDHGHGRWKRGFYIVRADACDLLGDWGEPVPDLPLGGPILEHKRVSLPAWLWGIIGIFTGWIIGYLHLRRGKSVHTSRYVRVTARVLIVLIAGCIIAGWIRSYWRVDELMFANGSSQHEIASYRGGIQYIVRREWKDRHPLAVGHFDRSITHDHWTISTMHLDAGGQLLGMAALKGHERGPDGALHPFTLLRMPYWLLLIPFALLALRLLFVLLRYVRRRRRGWCGRCGYDLRASADGRCPECGAASTTGLEAGDEVAVGGEGVGV
jgi:hypothetical protein